MGRIYVIAAKYDHARQWAATCCLMPREWSYIEERCQLDGCWEPLVVIVQGSYQRANYGELFDYCVARHAQFVNPVTGEIQPR